MQARVIAFLFTLTLLFSACSEYGKVQKSKDIGLKFEKANEYYNNGEYLKAYPLLEELIVVYRGTQKAEKLYYMLAYSDYHLEDYLLAAFHFKQFTKNYPTSKYAEECLFMAAICHYKNSPNYSLDQTDTYKAMSELQLFLNQYPKSARIDTCNILMDNLRGKLQKKFYEISHQYYHTRNYKAAIVSFGNLLKDYPGTQYREDANYYIVRSHYELAVNSILSKKAERLENAINAYVKFVDAFPDSRRLKEVENLYEIMLREKEKLNNTNS